MVNYVLVHRWVTGCWWGVGPKFLFPVAHRFTKRKTLWTRRSVKLRFVHLCLLKNTSVLSIFPTLLQLCYASPGSLRMECTLDTYKSADQASRIRAQGYTPLAPWNVEHVNPRDRSLGQQPRQTAHSENYHCQCTVWVVGTQLGPFSSACGRLGRTQLINGRC